MILGDPTLVAIDWSPENVNPINPADLFPRYRLLEDHWMNDRVYLAGTIVRADGIDFPLNWVPTPNVEPINLLATNEFYFLGPRDLGLVRQQWQPTFVAAPVTYWRQIRPGFWALTGLGSNQSTYPPIYKDVGHPVGGYPQ